MYAIDQRNHGLSPHSPVFTYAAMADDVQELIETERLQKPVLLGHSMGGKTAMYYDLQYPGSLDKLVVADMSPRAYEPHHEIVFDALQAVDFSQIKNRKEAEAILTDYLTDFGTRQFLLKNIYWPDDPSGQMNWRFNLPVILENYPEILQAVPDKISRVKCLFIRGEKSDYISDLDLPDIARRFPQYAIQTIPGAGHWVHAEQPAAFSQALLAFLRN